MRSTLIALTTLFSVSACVHTQEIDSKTSADFEAYFQALTDLDQFNGTVIIVQNGKTVHHQAYTQNGDLPPSMPVSIDSQYDIRSISKLVAKAVILQLEQTGLLSRKDSVASVFPSFPRGAEITVQHLMDNASGLPREFSDTPENQLEMEPLEIVSLAMTEALRFDPGTDTLYSNVGYEVLYAMIAQVSGQSFVQYVENNIFAPAEMMDSGGHFYSGREVLDHYAYGHETDDGQITPLLQFANDELKPAKLFSTASDLARFGEFLQTEPYRSELANEIGVISHAGGSDGKRAYLEAKANGDYTFAFLTNFDGIPFGKLVDDIRAITTGAPYEIPKAVNRVSRDVDGSILKRYIGRYRFAEINGLLLETKLEDGILVLYQNGESIASLMAETETVFFDDPKSAESIEFRVNQAGQIEMLMDFQGVQWLGVKVEFN